MRKEVIFTCAKFVKRIRVEFCAPLKKFAPAKKRLEMLQSFAEIITVNGRPFEYLVDSGFQRIIKGDLELLSDGGMPINFSHHFHELKEFIADIALNIKNQIIIDLKNRHISIMMDIGSKNNKSLLGISSQCIIDDKVVIHSLGVIPLDSSHTASFIQQKLLECLDGFGIQYDLVISVTTDNARNMIATINNLDEHLIGQSEHVPESNTIQQPMDSILHDGISHQLNQQEIEEIFNQAADDEELERIINDEEDFEQLFTEIIGGMGQSTKLVNTVRCGAHTLQLMVRDAIDKSNFKRILTLCRAAVKLLRTQKYRHDAKEAEIEYTLPVMFCTTRWDADYLMVISKKIILPSISIITV